MQPTITDWQDLLRSGDLNARELTQHYLTRLDEVEHLNAVVARDDDAALAAADRADERRRAGEDTPLLGIPVTVKDMIDAVGLPCSAGSRARPTLPDRDAEVVRRVKAAGGVVLAKTNMPELGLSYETDNAVNGRTLHPFDPERTPGGSSGGEAALLAADASLVGIGTDGGGSIRVPSAYCGLVGLRPTAGRVPLTGAWPPGRAGSMTDLICAGPMGRSVADVAILLDVLSGPDLVDPFAHPVPLREWTGVDVSGLRVGWYVDDGVAEPTAPVRDAVMTAAASLADAGAHVRQTRPPSSVARATELFFRLTAADGGDGLRGLVGDAPGDHTAQFLQLMNHPPYGGSRSALDYFAIQRAVFDLRADVRRWVDEVDVIVAPVVAGQAPLHDTPPAGLPASRYLRYESFNYTHTYSLAGLPAGTVPVAVADGLPVGVQLVAPAWREDLVLAAARVLESAHGGFALSEPFR